MSNNQPRKAQSKFSIASQKIKIRLTFRLNKRLKIKKLEKKIRRECAIESMIKKKTIFLLLELI